MSTECRGTPRRNPLLISLQAPTQRANSRHLPSLPRISLHTLHLPLLHLSRSSPMRLNSESPTKIYCSSGPTKQTHPTLSTCTSSRRGTIQQRDVFVCANGVNAARLLMLSRKAMDNQVQYWGGNALVDEAWSYTIRQCKSSQGTLFKVSIIYTAVVAQCDRPDPGIPVAIEEARSIPGLMTVLSRQ